MIAREVAQRLTDPPLVCVSDSCREISMPINALTCTARGLCGKMTAFSDVKNTEIDLSCCAHLTH